MLKIILVLLLCILSVGGQSRCRIEQTMSILLDRRPINRMSSDSQSSNSVSPEAESSESQPKDDSKTESASKPTAGSNTESKGSEQQWPSIEPQLLYNQDGIMITIESISRTYNNNLQCDFTVENTSNENMEVHSYAALINDCFSAKWFIQENVEPGNTRHISTDIHMDELKSCGIKTVGDIKMQFRVDNDDYSYITISDVLDVPTTLSDQMDKNIVFDEEEFLELYNKDGLIIYGTYTENYFLDNPAVQLIFFNQTDQGLDLNTYQISVNDTMTYCFFPGVDIYPNSFSVSYLEIDRKTAEESGVEDMDNVKEISFNFEISRMFEYTSFDETGLITMRRA